MADLFNLMWNFFLLHWVICVGGNLSVHTYCFFKSTWISGGFLSVPHLVDFYAKNVDERGRNFMCKCTLLSFLVVLYELLSVFIQNLQFQILVFLSPSFLCCSRFHLKKDDLFVIKWIGHQNVFWCVFLYIWKTTAAVHIFPLWKPELLMSCINLLAMEIVLVEKLISRVCVLFAILSLMYFFCLIRVYLYKEVNSFSSNFLMSSGNMISIELAEHQIRQKLNINFKMYSFYCSNSSKICLHDLCGNSQWEKHITHPPLLIHWNLTYSFNTLIYYLNIEM